MGVGLRYYGEETLQMKATKLAVLEALETIQQMGMKQSFIHNKVHQEPLVLHSLTTFSPYFGAMFA